MPHAADTVSHAVAVVTAAIDRSVDSGEAAPTLDALATLAHVSPSHLRRIFEQTTGVTPRAYADARRGERLRAALHAGGPVADAISSAGFGSSSRVYERTDALLGMTPAAFRHGAPGEAIRYALAASSLGRLVVAWTERGVCLIAFGESDDALAAEVSRRFPRAKVEPAPAEESAWVRAVVELVDAAEPGGEAATSGPAALPLDVRGTAFQQQVWSALRRIPAGETVTYAQLAAAIGRPSATRAVAQACGANPLAVAVPCHRVIGADGTLTGYRWGVERKRTLLEREQGRSR